MQGRQRRHRAHRGEGRCRSWAVLSTHPAGRKRNRRCRGFPCSPRVDRCASLHGADSGVATLTRCEGGACRAVRIPDGSWTAMEAMASRVRHPIDAGSPSRSDHHARIRTCASDIRASSQGVGGGPGVGHAVVAANDVGHAEADNASGLDDVGSRDIRSRCSRPCRSSDCRVAFRRRHAPAPGLVPTTASRTFWRSGCR